MSDLIRGVTYSKDVASALPGPDLVPVLRANNLQGRSFDLDDLVYVPRPYVSQQQFLRAGDVVVATSSGSISVVGKAVAVQQDLDAGFGAFCGVLRPSPAINQRYFGHYFSSDAYRSRVSELARGVNINNLKRDHFASLELPVAPEKEQQRIADKIDTLLARVDACRERLDRVAPLLKRFRQSILAAATSGQLTEDWRKKADQQTTRERFSDLVLESLVGLVRSSSEQSDLGPGLVPYLRMNSIAEDWGYRLEGLVGVRCSEEESHRYALRPGDWLFNTRNSVELVGKSCVWKAGPVVFNNNILRVRFQPRVLPDFVEIWFRSPTGREALASIKSATTSVAAIYQRSLFAVQLDLPAADEQAEIVSRVETLFAFADRMEARLAQAQTAVERLTPSLLAKAFRGELVPQDPADEPATELLARLHRGQQAPVVVASVKRPQGRPKKVA